MFEEAKLSKNVGTPSLELQKTVSKPESTKKVTTKAEKEPKDKSAAQKQPMYEEYKLFPELYNQCSFCPTFSDLFGQPLAANYQEPATKSEDTAKRNYILPAAYDLSELVSSIYAAYGNSEKMNLVIGEDLTTLGLDLASDGDIYVNFNSPFTTKPPRRNKKYCDFENEMREFRDSVEKYTTEPPTWDAFVPEICNLGLKCEAPTKLEFSQLMDRMTSKHH